MRNLFFVTVVVALSITNLQAKIPVNQKTSITLQLIHKLSSQQDEKVKIKKEELPETARKTLEGDAFKGWTISNTYKLKNGDFEVELQKGEQKQAIKFDKEGKVKSE